MDLSSGRDALHFCRRKWNHGYSCGGNFKFDLLVGVDITREPFVVRPNHRATLKEGGAVTTSAC